MKIFKLLKNPLIKTSAVVAIIYFALFSNKENPNSLGNRLSPTNLQKDFSEVSSKTKFIFYNVGEVKKYATERKELLNATKQKIRILKTQDLKLGTQNQANCGDKVSVSYSLFDHNDNELYNNNQELIIGTQHDLLLEEKVQGMLEQGVRVVFIPHDFKSDNKILEQFLVKNSAEIKYQITLLKVSKPLNSTIFCD